MANVHDVAAYIADRYESIDAVKLQKLVYYTQAWHLVAHDAPLFPETIKAYKHGPVVGRLWHRHRGMRTVTADTFRPEASGILTSDETALIDAVLDAYGSMEPWELVRLTHRETPWVDAWESCAYDDRIDPEAMRHYYATISAAPRELIDAPVPRIPHARVSYMSNRDLETLTADLDTPDDVSALVSAFRAAADGDSHG